MINRCIEGFSAIGRTSRRLSSHTTTRVSSLQLQPPGQLASAAAPLRDASSSSEINSTRKALDVKKEASCLPARRGDIVGLWLVGELIFVVLTVGIWLHVSLQYGLECVLSHIRWSVLRLISICCKDQEYSLNRSTDIPAKSQIKNPVAKWVDYEFPILKAHYIHVVHFEATLHRTVRSLSTHNITFCTCQLKTINVVKPTCIQLAKAVFPFTRERYVNTDQSQFILFFVGYYDDYV